jgi:hypothetical protein
MIANPENYTGNDMAVGNVILSVNQIVVASVADLKNVLKKLSQNEAVLKIKEAVLYVFDPQTRKSDYIVVNFNPPTKNHVKKRKQPPGKVTLPQKSDKSFLEKLKERLKTQWRFI